MLVTLVQIHRIIQSVTFLIWLLDASATRRIVMGDGETNLAAIIEGQRTLHQSCLLYTSVGLAKLLGIGADCIERNHDVAVNHIILSLIHI